MESTTQKYFFELAGQYFFMYSIAVLDIREVSYEATGEAITECIENGKVSDGVIEKFATLTYEQLGELLTACNPHNGGEDAIAKALTEYISNL